MCREGKEIRRTSHAARRIVRHGLELNEHSPIHMLFIYIYTSKYMKKTPSFLFLDPTNTHEIQSTLQTRPTHLREAIELLEDGKTNKTSLDLVFFLFFYFLFFGSSIFGRTEIGFRIVFFCIFFYKFLFCFSGVSYRVGRLVCLYCRRRK